MYLEQEIEIVAIGQLVELADVEIEFENPIGVDVDAHSSSASGPNGQKFFAGIALKTGPRYMDGK